MKRLFWITLFAAGVFVLTGCSQDEMPEGGNKNPDPSIASDAFFGFQLVDNQSTSGVASRSTHKEYDDDYENFEWFNKGTADERAIIDNSESNSVLFFKSDYSYYGNGPLEKPSKVEGVADNVYVARKPAGKNPTELPAFALVILNSDPERLIELDAALTAAGANAVKTALTYLNMVDTDDPESMAMYDGYFTMSSSLYVDELNQLHSVVPLNTDGPVFYETIEEAVLPENLTRFTVERILAKYTLIIKDGNITFGQASGSIIVPGTNKFNVRMYYEQPEGVPSKDEKTDWKVNLVNWGVNGVEKNTYMFKNLVENPGAYPWQVEQNFYTLWNSVKLERSYWSIDQNYSTGFYPYQYRQAFDEEGVTSATVNSIYSADYNAANGLQKDDYTLVYKPYSAYTDRTDNKYSVENTFDTKVLSQEDLATKPYLRCGTHIILTAQLIFDNMDSGVDLTKTDASGFIQGISDKYFSNGLWWSETALKQQAVATLMTNIYYNKKGDANRIPDVVNGGYVEYINFPGDDTRNEKVLNTDVPLLVVVNGQDVEFKHENLAEFAEEYFEFAPAFIKGGDGWVTLKKKDGVIFKANYINADPAVITDAQLVSYIYYFTNLAKHYNQGRMYYALPIRHNLDSENFAQNTLTKVATGDFGTVRNTWYRLTLTSVLHPGTPVDDPNQPIIPNPEPDDKSLGVEVEIIPWRTVNITVDQLH